MNRLDAFNEHRPLLMSIAYRMLGSRADAEDAVQETFLRWRNAPDDEIQSPKSFLATVVTRLCIDQLRSARVQRQVYTGPWLPEPVVTTHQPEPTWNLELAESLTMAFLVLLERLSPTERAAFLLHEVFDYEYEEIADMLSKSEANCRQIIHRAKERIQSHQRRFEASREETSRVAHQFMEASQNGDLSRLMALFADDAVLVSDGGGKVRAALNPVHGANPIARFVLGVLKKNLPLNASHEMAEINGQPAFITMVDGNPIAATILDIRGGLIRTLFVVANPDKLQRIGTGL